jgi:signal transduction histidine kinase
MAEEVQTYGRTVSAVLERPCVGTWDRMRIDQVVVNLVSNAAKYGGGKPIDVELESGGRGVLLRVRDRGIGIARVDQERIFHRFGRTEPVRHYGGFGLGLWIARQIVEASGGTITVDSTPGQGSTFVVDLPR